MRGDLRPLQQQAQRRFLAPASTFHLCESFEGYIYAQILLRARFPAYVLPKSQTPNTTTKQRQNFIPF